jgi:hypothetical protein
MDTVLLASSRAYWVAAVVLGIVDAAFIAVLVRRLPAELLAGLRRVVTVTALAFWALLWGATFWGDAWATSYGLVLPHATRPVLPVALTLLYTAVAVVLLRVAPRLPGPPVPWVCLLGALSLQPETLWELYDLDMLHRVPALQGIAPAALLAYGLAESVLYWCMILAIAPLLRLGLASLLDRLR